jgi:hypothetical protein
MIIYSKLILLALATIWLVQAFESISEQQRLKQGGSLGPGTFGDDSFNEFVLLTMKAFHVPGLSLAVIENGQICAEVTLRHLVGMIPLGFADSLRRAMGLQTSLISRLLRTHSISLEAQLKPSPQRL